MNGDKQKMDIFGLRRAANSQFGLFFVNKISRIWAVNVDKIGCAEILVSMTAAPDVTE